MMDYRRLHDEITEVVAQGLHYAENMEKINAMRTAADVAAAIEGGVDRYMKDPIYHAKVQSLVARLMQVIEQNIETPSRMIGTVKHGRKQYDLVNYHTAGVYLPEAFYTVTELNEFITTIEQRNAVANLALARSMEQV